MKTQCRVEQIYQALVLIYDGSRTIENSRQLPMTGVEMFTGLSHSYVSYLRKFLIQYNIVRFIGPKKKEQYSWSRAKSKPTIQMAQFAESVIREMFQIQHRNRKQSNHHES